MSLIRRAAATLEQRGASGTLPWGDTVPPPPGSLGMAVGGTQVTTQSALQIAAVYGSVGLIADTVSALPLRLLDSPPSALATAKELKLPQLLVRPYEPISLTDWLVCFVWSLALRGNFFGQVVERDRRMFPTQIMPINPDGVRVRQEYNGTIEYNFYGQTANPDDVFHVKYQALPGMLVGLNPIEVMRYPFGLARASDTYAESYFRNSANPSGVLETEGDLTQEETEALVRRWMGAHQGVNQANLPAVLTGGLKFNPTMINPRDSQFLEVRQFSESQICGRIFRVPPHMIGIVDRSTCLAGETLVHTEGGPVQIRDIKPGTKVWSLDEHRSAFALAPVSAIAMTGIDPVLTIKTVGRTLRANAQHRVMVRRKHPDPQPGMGGYRKVKWVNEWVHAGDLKVGDLMIAAHGLPASDVQTAPNGRELTEGFMACAGLLAGDGNVLLNAKGEPSYVTFARHSEARYMPAYREFMQAEFVRSTMGGRSTYADRPQAPVTLREYERCTTFTSRIAAQELADLGFSGVARTKRIPEWVFGIAPDLQLAFLRGYADADGHVNEAGEIIYSSVNPDLLQDVRHLCIGLGIPVADVYSYRAKPSGLLAGRRYERNPKMYQLGCYSAPHNLRIGSHDEHDLARLKAAALRESKSGRVNRWAPNYEGRGGSPASRPGTDFTLEGAVLHRIVSIEKSVIAEPVYDLTVDGTHTFLADGLVVHNSWGRGIEVQERGFVTNTLQGYLTRAERSLAECLPRGQYPNFDLSTRLRGTALERAETASMMMLAGAWCTDDARGLFDQAPLPNGEGKRFYVPINTELAQRALAELKAMKEKPQEEPAGVPSSNGSGDPANVAAPQ